MNVSIIAAVANNNVIGYEGKMPWHLPEDLKHFKEVTGNSPVIMGRVTYESIITALGHPLPNRKNIVVSSTLEESEEFEVFSSLDDALGSLKDYDQEVFVIGGQRMYAEALQVANKLYITEIDKDYVGDTFFPEIDSTWIAVSFSQQKNERINFRFVEYTRN